MSGRDFLGLSHDDHGWLDPLHTGMVTVYNLRFLFEKRKLATRFYDKLTILEICLKMFLPFGPLPFAISSNLRPFSIK